MDKFQISMIHGFGTSGREFQAKATPITDSITRSLTPKILGELPGGIEYIYPDAPIVLESPIGFGGAKGYRREFHRGWWYGLDVVTKYKGVEESFQSVTAYIRGHPVHAVISFSQGAALGGMVTSMLDCRDNPAKIAAIRAQGLPVDDYLALPGQEPLRFYVGCGGYRGTKKYYGSLYQWPIRTSSCHTLASMDALVKENLTLGFAYSFPSHKLLYYYGTHFVPRDCVTVNAITDFVVRNFGSLRTLNVATGLAEPMHLNNNAVDIKGA